MTDAQTFALIALPVLVAVLLLGEALDRAMQREREGCGPYDEARARRKSCR